MAQQDYDPAMSQDEVRAAEKARADANNADTILNAAEVAEATGHPVAVAIGKGVKVADKITGGKSTEMLGKGMTHANKMAPFAQGITNKVAESGLGDKIGTAASMKSGSGGQKAAENAEKAKKAKEAAEKAKEAADRQRKAQEAAKKAQDAKKAKETADTAKGKNPDDKSKKSKKEAKKEVKDKKKGGQDSSPSSSDDAETKGGGLFGFLAKSILASSLLIMMPVLLVIVSIIAVAAAVSGLLGNFDDSFGMGTYLGEDTGGMSYSEAGPEQKDFYVRISDLKFEYQGNGKEFDPMRVIAVFHIIQSHGDMDYNKATDGVIKEWADSMLNDGAYNEIVFRENLVSRIYPKYVPGKSSREYEAMADETFDYIDTYNTLVGREASGSSCSAIGSCSYDIKGFYVPGKGNVLKSLNVKDLKVRLMQCGSPYANGSFTTPINQPLVDFEDYVAGVAYGELGSTVSVDVYKAQMVAARSYALSRPTSLNNADGKKLVQENGQWILQISSCAADKVYCDIDKGCSYIGGTNGQNGYVVSDIVSGATRTKPALDDNHILRQALSETQGEVLVNAQGYIIATDFSVTEQQQWIQNVQSGLNYKQVLIQTYNQGTHNYGAKDIYRYTCNVDGSSSCISTGEFANWKQRAPEWSNTPMGTSGKTLGQIGCLVTSVSMLLAKSGVALDPSIKPLSPETFVKFLNNHGGIDHNGNYQWYVAQQAAPTFKYQGQIILSGMGKDAKLNKIKEIVGQKNVYAVAEVKGNTGQHWVAIDSVTGSTINMMDPSTDSTDMWAQYSWSNTSVIAFYKVG